MPVFNVETYVGETIRSVQAQTATDWELIVVNDGSTDGTGRVVRALAAEDPRIRVLDQRNGGVARARNLGLDLVRGRFLVFLDGDDLWREGFLAKAVARLEATGTDFFHCGVEHLRADAGPSPVAPQIHPGISSSVDLMNRHFASGVQLLMGNVMLRNTPKVRALRFADGCRHGEDTEYLLRALALTDSASLLEERLFIYRVRPGSATHRPWDWRFRLDAILAMERVLAHLSGQADGWDRHSLEEGLRRLRYSQYRLLYQMVKSGAWDEVRALLAQEGWREALRSVRERAPAMHRCKARIVQGQNPLAWRLVAAYAGNRFWTSART